jgi:hypothetical protein
MQNFQRYIFYEPTRPKDRSVQQTVQIEASLRSLDLTLFVRPALEDMGNLRGLATHNG